MRQALQEKEHGAPIPYEARVAVYRAAIGLYLRIVALRLAVQAGRIPRSDVGPDVLDDAAPTSPIVGLTDQLTNLLPPERRDVPGPNHDTAEYSPLPLHGGEAGDGGASTYLSPDLALDEPRLLRNLIAAAFNTAEGTRSPAGTLTAVYEGLLSYTPSRAPAFSLEPSAGYAKRHGAFYTRPDVARTVVEAALHAVDDRVHSELSSLRVLDPAMGTGVFLLEAVHALMHAAGGSAAEAAESCVHGFDLDPLAVDVAVLSLWIETGARREFLTRHLRRFDAEWTAPPVEGEFFDLVVGNPPWGATHTSAERKALRERWHCLGTGSFDSFKVFLELAVERSTGAIGMILPRAILCQSSHAGARELLLQRFAPYVVQLLGARDFPRAVAPACGLIFGPKPGPPVVAYGAAVNRTVARSIPIRIPARHWTRERFPLGEGATLDLLDRIGRVHPRIGQTPHLYRVRDAGINYNRAAIARRVLYDGEYAEHPCDLPRYRGRNFGRYGAIQRAGWLRHDASRRLEPGEHLYLSLETYGLPQKVVLRQTADRITATLDGTCMAMGRSVLAVVAEGDAPLLPLLACLNSRLLTCFYRALAGEEGRVLPQVKVKTILLLPLPGACLDGRRDAAWMQLGEMARVRLACQGDDIHLDREIDHAVGALFGLTAQEMAEIETQASSHATEY